MSTYCGIRCLDHDTKTGTGMNHGQNILQDVIKTAPYILKIRKLDRYGYIEFDLMGGFDGGYYDDENNYHEVYLFDWLCKHAHCNLLVYDEYDYDYDKNGNRIKNEA